VRAGRYFPHRYKDKLTIMAFDNLAGSKLKKIIRGLASR